MEQAIWALVEKASKGGEPSSMAIWALVISAFSLGVSLVVGLWQIWLYFLEGGRLLVTLEIGQLYPEKLSRQSVVSRHSHNPFSTADGNRYIEVLLVTVANKGRTAATVVDVGIDLGVTESSRNSSRRKQRRNRHRVTPVAFDFGGATVTIPHRIEPLDSCLFIFDAEPALLAELTFPTTTRSMRGTAVVAGLSKPRLSKEVLDVRNGRLHLTGDKPRVERIVFAVADRDRRLAEKASQEVPFPHAPDFLVFQMNQAMNNGATVPEAVETVFTEDDDPGLMMMRFRVQGALRLHGLWPE